MKTIYFAHPVTHYNKNIEIECIHIITTMLMPLEYADEVDDFDSIGPEFEIMNPNQQWLQNVYQNRKKENHPDPFNIFREIASACDITVGCTFYDGILGAGVANEMKTALEDGKDVYLIFLDNGRKLFLPITSLDNFRILSIEETREKTKKGEV